MNKPIRKATRCFILDKNKVLVIKYNEPNRKAGWYDIPGGKLKRVKLLFKQQLEKLPKKQL